MGKRKKWGKCRNLTKNAETSKKAINQVGGDAKRINRILINDKILKISAREVFFPITIFNC